MDLLYIRSYIPDYDGKFNKYRLAIESLGCQWYFLGWNRSGVPFKSRFHQKSRFFNKKSALGGGWKTLLNIFLWNLYIFLMLILYVRKVKVIHVVDLDSAIFPFLFAKLFRKKIVFDVYDKYTSMRSFPRPLKKILDSIERFILYHSDLSIIADEKRIEQHQLSIFNNLLIIENVPLDISDQSFVFDSDRNKLNVLKIGYFGVLEKKNRGLEDLISVILSFNSKIELHIVGYGELEEDVARFSKNNPEKIFFYGAKSSDDGLVIMRNMDILVGFYYKNVPNHLYAAPNKYFEHLMLGKPLLTTSGTPPGDKVILYNTGWALDEGVNAISECLLTIDSEDLFLKSKNAFATWNKYYSNYFKTIFCDKYALQIINFIKKR